VVVFKYPEDAKTNYIKRLVGLPGETVVITGGDIWTVRGDAPATIARKPPERMLAMLQCVSDSDRVSPELAKVGWPTAWTDWSAPEANGCRWTTDDAGRSFSAACSGNASATLRYRHLVPAFDDWRTIRSGGRPAAPSPAPVDDFQPYNTQPTRLHAVGDLAVSCMFESRSTAGRVAFDLVETGERHRVEIDLADGHASLAVPGGTKPATAATPVRGRGSWRIQFANVDDELSLFVDGRRIAFDSPTAWSRPLPAEPPALVLKNVAPGSGDPSDLAPAGITVTNADVRVTSLRLLRDLFYIAAVDVEGNGRVIEDEALEFPLGEGQYLMLGDNSAASKDSRLWLDGHHVDRRLLIGKALVVFWPHAVPASWSVPLRFGGWDLRLPSWPNFGRMRFVR
jgi:signal peptidase I